MQLSPLPSLHPRYVPVGILHSSGELECENGAQLFYANSVNAILRKVRKQGGIGVAIRSPERYRWLSFRVADDIFYPLGEGITLSEAQGFRDYCYDRGISARSPQSMGFYLLRSSLAGTVSLDDGRSIPLKHFPAGAFTYAKEGEWDNLYQSDIVAAYLHSLGNFHSPQSFTTVQRMKVSEICEREFGFALVSVRGRTKYTPRLSSRGETVYGSSRGWSADTLLSFGDIRIAAIMGCDIRVRTAWVAQETTLPFLPFLRQMTAIRRSECPFHRLAKIATNSVWGSFTAGSLVKEIHFRPGLPTKTFVLPRRKKICQPLAYSVIGSLRERIIMEGMSSGVVQAHTDGILGTNPIHTGDEPGDWRVSGYADRATVVRPSCYSVTVNGSTTYKVSGYSGSGERLRDMFRERIERHGD